MVIDARPSADAVRRRRRCDTCHHRFSTYEVESSIFDCASREIAEARASLINDFAMRLPPALDLNLRKLRPRRE